MIINRFKTLPLHPLLFVIYPILFVYTQNVSQVGPTELVFPFLFAFIATSVFFIFCALIFKNINKASIFVSISLALFFFYGHFYDGSKWLIHIMGGSQELTTAIIKDRFLIPAFLSLLLGCGVLIKFSKIEFHVLSKIVTVFVVSLIAINCFQIAKYFTITGYKTQQNYNNQPEIFQEKIGSNVKKPDVYFITLDEFVGLKTLINYYQYNPSWFFDFLQSKGFHVIPQSRNNYFETWNCLHSILNMDYIHRNPDFINKNKVASIFESLGYKINNSVPPKNISDALNLEVNKSFIMELIQCSMLKSVGNEFHRFKILYIFNNFNSLIYEKSPKFIHVHILCPHVPFIFDSTGARLSYNDKENWKNKNIYLGQWIFVAKKIQSLVDSILTHSPAPIIIIQSDHGVRSLSWQGSNPPIIHNENKVVYIDRDLSRPLNYFQVCSNNVEAFYFPDNNYKDLYDSLSPVNTFRIVLNHFFNADYKLLPDNSFTGPLVTKKSKTIDSMCYSNVTEFTHW